MSGLNKDFNRQEFCKEVCEIIKNIPAGRVATYGLVARLAGKPQYSRLAGQVLSCIPSSLSLPCHRVVNSQGRLAPNWPEQRQLLEEEQVDFKNNGCVDLKRYLWNILR